jgi:hypothetical protein
MKEIETFPNPSLPTMQVLNRTLRAGVAALSLSLLASPSAFAGGSTVASKDIVDTAVSAGSFKTLTARRNPEGEGPIHRFCSHR